jgi:hypothetical protein
MKRSDEFSGDGNLRALLVICLGLIGCFVSLFADRLSDGRARFSLAQITLISLLSSLATLFVLWVGIGTHQAWIRMIGALMIGLGFAGGPKDFFGPKLIAFTASIGLIAALPCFAMWLLGFRLVKFSSAAAEAEYVARMTRLQFSLRRVFVLTAAVAIAAFLMRGLFSQESGPVFGAQVLGALTVISLSAPAAAITALGPRNPVRRSFGVAGLFGILALVFLELFPNLAVQPLEISAWATLNLLFSAGALLLYRRIGFRLVRTLPEKALNRGQHKSDSSAADRAVASLYEERRRPSADCADFRRL